MTPDPNHSPERPAPGVAARAEPRGMPAEVQYLNIVLALFGLLLVSGVPGTDVPEAGDGTGVLRKGWAESWSAEFAAQQAEAPADDSVNGSPADDVRR
jgi:hypothetical protein